MASAAEALSIYINWLFAEQRLVEERRVGPIRCGRQMLANKRYSLNDNASIVVLAYYMYSTSAVEHEPIWIEKR